MIPVYATIFLIALVAVQWFRSHLRNKRLEQDRYQNYCNNYLNPVNFEYWKEMEQFKHNLRLLFRQSKPYDANHYDLDRIMETYPKDRIVRKLREDLGIKVKGHGNKQSSLGFTVTDEDNLFNFFEICEELILTNCSYTFPINGHSVILGRSNGQFFISMPYKVMSRATWESVRT